MIFPVDVNKTTIPANTNEGWQGLLYDIITRNYQPNTKVCEELPPPLEGRPGVAA